MLFLPAFAFFCGVCGCVLYSVIGAYGNASLTVCVTMDEVLRDHIVATAQASKRAKSRMLMMVNSCDCQLVLWLV